jgi:hypothetical protein
MSPMISKFGKPFIQYVLGPLLVAIFSFYLGQKNETRSDKGYEMLAKALNVELQATLEHIDARLDGLEARMLRAENTMLAYKGPAPTTAPATQPVVVPVLVKPPKPQVPTKAEVPSKAPPPEKAPRISDARLLLDVKAPAAAKKAPMRQFQVPARMKDF